MTLVLEDVRLPLAHFDLHVTAQAAGPVIGIFGPSGAGKTSLLDTIAGLRFPRHGLGPETGVSATCHRKTRSSRT